MPVQEQVVSLYSATHGYLDPIPVVDVQRFEEELLVWFRTRHNDILDAIRTTGVLPDEAALEAGIKAFADGFVTSEGHADTPEARAQAEEERARAGGMTEGILPEDEISRDE